MCELPKGLFRWAVALVLLSLPVRAEPFHSSTCTVPAFRIQVAPVSGGAWRDFHESEARILDLNSKIQLHLLGSFPGYFYLLARASGDELYRNLQANAEGGASFFFPCGNNEACPEPVLKMSADGKVSKRQNFAIAYWPCRPETMSALQSLLLVFRKAEIERFPSCSDDRPPKPVDDKILESFELGASGLCPRVFDSLGRTGIVKHYQITVHSRD